MLKFWNSTIGKKVVMAVTGLIGIGFVIGHMVGNLQMFIPGAEHAQKSLHDYAKLLRISMPALWAIRLTLIAAVILHAKAAADIWRSALVARPQGYQGHRYQVASLGVRTMRVGGTFLMLFIVWHLLDITNGIGHPNFRHLDPYHNLQVRFTQWWAVLIYVAAMVSLGLHLYHGAWAAFRTLGLKKDHSHPLQRSVAIGVAVVVAVGFAAVPIAGMLGLFKPVAPLPEATHAAAPVTPSASAPVQTAEAAR